MKCYLNIYFKNNAQGKLTRVCNVESLSVGIYKKIAKNNYTIYNKYVEFVPHHKNLDDISKPSIEELTRLGYKHKHNFSQYF